MVGSAPNLKIKGEFRLDYNGANESESKPVALTVAETYVPSYLRLGRREQLTQQFEPLARLIVPHLQLYRHPKKGPAPQPTDRQIAWHMASEKGWSIAYEGAEPGAYSLLAFSHIHRMNPTLLERIRGVPVDFVLTEFGVIYNGDLMEERERGSDEGTPARYLGACAALLYCALEGLGDREVAITRAPVDSRRGVFFQDCGFLPAQGECSWQAGETVLMAKAPAVCEQLAEQYPFLPKAATQATT